MKRRYTYVLILFLLLTAVRFIRVTSEIPLLIYGDSTIYMELAGSLVKGEGYRVWLNGLRIPYFFFPPQYPVVIAGIQWLTGISSPVEAARWISLFSLLVTLVFIYKTLELIEINKLIVFIFLFLYVNSWIYPLYYIVLSEHLFLMFLSIQLYFLTHWIKYRRRCDLLIMGVLSAFLFLTRYAALGIMAPLALVIFLLSRKNRWRNTLIYLAPAVLAMVVWHGLASVHTDGFYGRRLGWHPPGTEHLRSLFITAVNWFTPGLTRLLFIPLVVLLLYIFIFRRRISLRRLIEGGTLYPVVLGFLAFSYLLFILLTITFFDYTTPLDNRMLAPFYMFGMVIFAWLIRYGMPYKWQWPVLAILLLSHAVYGYRDTSQRLRHQLVWRHITSPGLKEFVRHSGTKIYSNAKDIIHPVTSDYRYLYDLPCRYDRMSLEPSPEYRSRLAEIRREIERGEASVIFFDDLSQRDFEVPKSELLEIFQGLPMYEIPENRTIIFSRIYPLANHETGAKIP